MRLVAADAVFIPHHGDAPFEGAKAIRENYWPSGSTGTPIDTFDREATEVGGSGNMGFVRGRFTLEFTFEDEGEQMTYSNTGNYLLIATRTGEGWKMKQLTWNDPVALVE